MTTWNEGRPHLGVVGPLAKDGDKALAAGALHIHVHCRRRGRRWRRLRHILALGLRSRSAQTLFSPRETI